MTTLVQALVLIVVWGMSGSANAQDIDAGRLLAEKLCVRCHGIGRSDVSKLAAAPPFRVIATRYSVWTLEESFAEGIVVGHTAMPEFVLNPDQITNLLSYMDTLTPRTKKAK
ncbi:MAG: c-type cytochrome [Hyphomicrobiaceae bacterium]